MELVQELEKLGLDQKEGKIFLAALRLGSAPLSVIARDAGVKRPTVHYLIPRLLEKGLLAKIPKKKRVYYAAVPPEKLMYVLNEQRRLLTLILPTLEGLYRSKPTHPTVRFYESKEGLETVYEEFFTTHKTLYSVLSAEQMFAVFSEDDNARLLQHLRDSGGKLIELVHQTPSGERYMKAEYRKGIGQAKFLSKDVDFTVDILATDQKVAFFSFPALLAVVIDDENIAHSQKSLIRFVWRNIKQGKSA